VKVCPKCNVPLRAERTGTFTEWICWDCGYYESDTPAYRAHPELFLNMIRDNPHMFTRRIVSPLDDQTESNRSRRPTKRYQSFQDISGTFLFGGLACYHSFGGQRSGFCQV